MEKLNAGQTNLPVGTRVQLQTREEELNGLTGFVTHPFAFGKTKRGWVGIYLEKTTTDYGVFCNVRETELKVL